ncbi:unnamed protein product [Rangifer tarandus platyrhynchus]|uniref:Uncharacterized protein n=1 Tax=Rangifer tarandus platyrhynchus TaxID=3082113 RepID=A0ABN8XX74_RANTA|nr:unnamed protein product [Rangifer tarandus platyrhynchus]
MKWAGIGDKSKTREVGPAEGPQGEGSAPRVEGRRPGTGAGAGAWARINQERIVCKYSSFSCGTKYLGAAECISSEDSAVLSTDMMETLTLQPYLPCYVSREIEDFSRSSCDVPF